MIMSFSSVAVSTPRPLSHCLYASVRLSKERLGVQDKRLYRYVRNLIMQFDRCLAAIYISFGLCIQFKEVSPFMSPFLSTWEILIFVSVFQTQLTTKDSSCWVDFLILYRRFTVHCICLLSDWQQLRGWLLFFFHKKHENKERKIFSY